jgi:hypothetical protein
MNLEILTSASEPEVRAYVTSKFRKFNGFLYPKSARQRKVLEYYNAAGGSPYGRKAVEAAYFSVFQASFPKAEAELLATQSAGRGKMEHGEWLHRQRGRKVELEETLKQLNQWKEMREFELGPEFMARLEAAAGWVDSEVFDTVTFATEFAAQCKRLMTADHEVTKTGVSGSVEGLIGFEQTASARFKAKPAAWTEINAKLEQSFKAGAWGSGQAEAKLAGLGFSTEVQAAVAIGAQFDITGEGEWKQGRGSLKLEGAGQLFVGAQVSADATFSLGARQGLQAAFAVNAFAGFSAQASGSCSFNYDGKTVASAEATAQVSFGVGGGFNASLSTPLFGPTAISVGANAAIGLGTGTDVKFSISFSEAALACSNEFKKVIYLPTLAKHYQMDLITSDAKNLYYLNKAIDRITEEIAASEETISSAVKIPKEKRPLLMDA